VTTVTYIILQESVNHWYKCNECEFEYILDNFKYCPNCKLEIDWSEIESTN
jgi:hypothetical protein